MTYNELCEAILTAQKEMLKCKIEANTVTLNGRKYGRLIENCPPNMKPTVFGMAVKTDYALPEDYDFLVQYEPPRPKTNADIIRAMTDEELAKYINEFSNGDCPPVGDCPEGIRENETCTPWQCWLSWLKAPADKEGEG